ncbi:MAG: hypothetical protein QM726_26330 [Chitinophagaceae bacterium]
MKKLVLALSMIALVFTGFLSCKKSKTDSEPYLTVETTPANKSNNLNILGPDFPLKVEITSVMPAKGVKIVVNAMQDGGTTAFFSATSNSTAPQNDYTITNTPSGVTCVVTITVTSLSQSSNTWSGSYRYSKK